MTEVRLQPLFVCSHTYVTQVWIAELVFRDVADYIKNSDEEASRWFSKAQLYAKGGFHNYEGKQGAIRYKWDGVYAIQPWATLFRLYGGYPSKHKQEFFVLSTTYKKGMKMRDHDKDQVDQAAVLLRDGVWRKIT